MFILLKVALRKVKYVLDTGQNFWQESSFGPGQHAFVGSLVAAVEKAVRLSIVAVEITVDGNALFSICLLLHDLLQEIDFRVDRRIRVSPPTIEIETNQRAASISYSYTICIDHRDKLDYVV